MRTRGGGGQKSRNFCGRHLWMVPNASGRTGLQPEEPQMPSSPSNCRPSATVITLPLPNSTPHFLPQFRVILSPFKNLCCDQGLLARSRRVDFERLRMNGRRPSFRRYCLTTAPPPPFACGGAFPHTSLAIPSPSLHPLPLLLLFAAVREALG